MKPAKGKKMLDHYCVNCGEVEPFGLEACPGSELGLTHLHTRIGHVLHWFKFTMRSTDERPRRNEKVAP